MTNNEFNRLVFEDQDFLKEIYLQHHHDWFEKNMIERVAENKQGFYFAHIKLDTGEINHHFVPFDTSSMKFEKFMDIGLVPGETEDVVNLYYSLLFTPVQIRWNFYHVVGYSRK